MKVRLCIIDDNGYEPIDERLILYFADVERNDKSVEPEDLIGKTITWIEDSKVTNGLIFTLG